MQNNQKVSSLEVFREFLGILWRYRKLLYLPLGLTFLLQLLWMLPRLAFPFIILALESNDRGAMGFTIAVLLLNNYLSGKLEMESIRQSVRLIRSDMNHAFILECLIPIANKGMQFHIAVPAPRVESRIYEADSVIDLIEWMRETLIAHMMMFAISFIPLAFVMPTMIMFTTVVFAGFVSLTIRMIRASEPDRLALRNGFEVQREKFNDLTEGNTTLLINGAVDRTLGDLKSFMTDVLKPLKIKEESHWITRFGFQRQQLMTISETTALAILVACAVFPALCLLLTGQSQISIPRMLLIQSLVGPMLESLWSISNVITSYIPRSTKIHALMEMTRAVPSKTLASSPVKIADQALCFEAINLEFEYTLGKYDYLTLQDEVGKQDNAKGVKEAIHIGPLNFKIESGQSVGIVGTSGGGKTTLFYLLAGLMNPTAGKLLVNGVDITTLDYQQYTEMLGVVTQDTQVLRGTVFANLMLAGADITREQASAALCLAQLDREVTLDTIVGEHGLKLSGGQRQRLALARALVKQRRGLLLDEATSALDMETEESIRSALDHNCTVIAVAHRFATIRNSDVVFVVDKGQIVESGNHEQLMDLNGRYARLARRQGMH